MGDLLTNLGLAERGGIAVVSSRDIARVYEKRHDNVLRDIKNIIAKDIKWGKQNYEESFYVEPQNGQIYREYFITRDGLTFLIMGYTGKKAMKFKISYITAFNTMQQKLQISQASMSYKEKLKALIAEIEANE